MRALCIAMLLLWAGAAPAAVNSRDVRETYSISGGSAVELRRQMNTLGPPGPGGRFAGYTTWNIEWLFEYRRDGTGCAIAGVAVDLKTVIVLPEWRNEAAAPADLRARWRQFMKALTDHEYGHRDHGMAAAREIDRGIAALPAHPNCDALGAAANALGARILRQYNQRDLDYGRSTGHGRLQGATWP